MHSERKRDAISMHSKRERDTISRFCGVAKNASGRCPARNVAANASGLCPARSLARGPLFAAILAIVAWFGLSCSEVHEPLDWREAPRGGLNAPPETLASGTLVKSSRSFHLEDAAGTSILLFTGRLERTGADIQGEAVLRWDLSALPAGTVTGAYIDLVLRDIEQADSAIGGPYALWMYEVNQDWDGDSLVTFPTLGDFVAGSGPLDTSGGTDSTDVPLSNVFEHSPDFISLISRWRASPETNHGIALLPAEENAPGFLRLVSREGTPRGSEGAIVTPALVVTLADTTISSEPVDDTYVIELVSGAIDLPDSLVLVSAGYVERAWLSLSLSDLIGKAGGPPLGSIVHRADLHLTLEPDNPWRLSGDELLTLLLYAVPGAMPDVPAPEPDDAVLIAERTIAAGDTAVDLDAHFPAQRIIEGHDDWLLLRAAAETGVFNSIVFRGAGAERAPHLEIVYSPPIDGRLGGRP